MSVTSLKISRTISLAAFVGLLALSSDALGARIRWEYTSDAELARYPVVAIAHWNKAALERRDIHGFGCTTTTEIVVERVIRGPAKPGTHKITIEWLAEWGSSEGHLAGMKEDPMQKNLWFFQTQTAPGSEDTAAHLILKSMSGIQPACLETYFEAIASKEASKAISTLLHTSQDPAILGRTLYYISAESSPWPYDGRFPSIDQDGNRMPEQAKAIQELLARKELMVPKPTTTIPFNAGRTIRPFAAAVYAKLTGEKGIPLLRQLLKDDDPEVRAVAAGNLVRLSDASSAGLICHALRGLRNPDTACKLIEALATWKDEHAVAALIGFLETDGGGFACGYGGDKSYVPALNARAELHELTGHWFPFDIERGLKAWQEARRQIVEGKDRLEKLRRDLPDNPFPCKAEIEGTPWEAYIIVSNEATYPVTISQNPSEIIYTFGTGGGGRTFGEPYEARKMFVPLKNGESIRILTRFAERDQPDRHISNIRLLYYDLGKKQAYSPWMGIVPVTLSSRWKGVRP